MQVRQGRPPDGGWGWMVIAGSFLTLTVLSIFSLCFSILYSEFLISQGVSSTTIAWVFNLHFFLWNAVGIFTGPLTNELGFRAVSMASSFCAGMCIFALVFAESVWFLLVFFALAGFFGGLGAKPCYLLLTLYFDRKRGRANAFLMAGACVAQFAGPLLIRYLLEEYAQKGANLILTGIVLNSLVGTSLFQPVEWHLKEDIEEGMDAEEEEEEEEGLKAKYKHDDYDPDAGVTEEMKAREAERRRRLGVNLSRRSSELSMLSLAISNIDLSSIPPSSHRGSMIIDTASIRHSKNAIPDGQTCLGKSLNICYGVVTNFKILKSPRALIIVIGGVFIISTYLNFLMTAPFAIQDLGYSLPEAAWCMSLGAITNFASRLLTSALSDQSWFNIRLVYMFGAFTISISTIVFGFLKELWHIQAMMVVWGCGVGINISLLVLVMPHYMGSEKMGSIFGVHSLATSISLITLGPMFGFIRDWSQSYRVTSVVMGSIGCLNVLLWCFMPAAVAYDKRKEQERRQMEEKEEEEKTGQEHLAGRV